MRIQRPRARRQYSIMKKLTYWGAFLVLGPISGTTARGAAWRNVKKRQPVLAALYVVAAAEMWLVLPLTLAELLRHLPR
jgi:hypothetical protein